MRRPGRLLALSFFLLVLGSLLEPAGALAEGCDEGEIRLSGKSACTRTGPASFVLAIEPESLPINPSPWYDFTLISDRNAEISVTLDYGMFRHRYAPRRSETNGSWQMLPQDSVRISDDGRRAQISLTTGPGEQRIAAQEVLSLQEREEWAQQFATRSGFTLSVIGTSREGRPILGLLGGTILPGKPLLIILGGQHPPEVPGTLGMRAFMETLSREGSLLLGSHGVLLIPDLNPDGIARGHWRLNAGLTDLNRDWGRFSQPETQAALDQIITLQEAGLDPFLLLDFHATTRDVYYTPSHEDELCPAGFATAWTRETESGFNGRMPDISASHTTGQGTAKTWFADRFGAPGITVEYGDGTDRSRIEGLSSAGARALIRLLTPASDGASIGALKCG